jgi:DNA replication protein DnaC
LSSLHERTVALGLHGLAEHLDEFSEANWPAWLIDVEEKERGRRSLERRIRSAKLGHYKPLVDFDWAWASKLDRVHLRELFELGFVKDGANIVLVGPNGVGKTMLSKNIAHACLLAGHSVLFTTASVMLNVLAAEDSASALERRLRRLCRPQVLCIDEVGYLSYGNRLADLLFEVVTRRYELGRPVIITTNKPFREWGEVFPNATCVVTLVDRLVHRSEVVAIEGDSYRLKEAQERSRRREAAGMTSDTGT